MHVLMENQYIDSDEQWDTPIATSSSCEKLEAYKTRLEGKNTNEDISYYIIKDVEEI